MASQRLVGIILLLAPTGVPLRVQAPGSNEPVRDSVRVAIDSLVKRDGSFGSSHAAGDFTGDRGAFTLLYRLAERSTDSVLTALIDCFTDSTVTRVQYRGRSLSRGGTCYIMLHNLVYRETDPDAKWPGNFFEFPTPGRLRAARDAWREAVKRHWYSTL